MLNENVCFQNLGLENCGLYERDMLMFLLKFNRIYFIVLNLKGNELGDEGVIMFGFFLSVNSLFEVLNFSWNVIYL